MIEIILVVSTVLGGIAAIGYFIEKARRARRQIALNHQRASVRKRHHENPLEMLIVEDDGSVAERLKEQFSEYSNDLSVSIAHDAGEALEHIRNQIPNVLLLDLMMPYGTAESVLGKQSDPDWIYTGLRLLEHIRNEEQDGVKPVWVAVITARSSPGTIDQLRRLLGANGKVYFKPFDTLQLEHDVVTALGIESKVPFELLK